MSERATVEDIRNRLARQTNASTAGYIQNESSLVYYKLHFGKKIGYDWLKGQVKEVSSELDEPLQMWKISGTESGRFMVSVKELEPRYEIDNSQTDFGEYE